MRICMPTDSSTGPASEARVYGHFGSAPCFVIFDTESGGFQLVENGGREHEHGQCNPFQSLESQRVDALVTGGIGSRALQLFRQRNIKVYRVTQERTATEVVESMRAGKLVEISMDEACAHHGEH